MLLPVSTVLITVVRGLFEPGGVFARTKPRETTAVIIVQLVYQKYSNWVLVPVKILQVVRF